jgi:DinB superfamily
MSDDISKQATREMNEQEKREMLESLEEGRKAMREALSGVDDAQASANPESGWSILGCVEHVAFAEQNLLDRLHRAQRSNQSLENRPREAKIAQRAADRSRRIDAPEMSQPHGRFPGLDQALAAFETARAETIRYASESHDDLRCWVTDHPLVPGPVNCYEILLMMAAHPIRHAKQIAEIREKLTRQTP